MVKLQTFRFDEGVGNYARCLSNKNNKYL